MRLYESTRQLSYESFVEIYGKPPHSKNKVEDSTSNNSMLTRSVEMASNIFRYPGTKTSKNSEEDINCFSDSQEHDNSSNSRNAEPQKETSFERMSKRLRKISLRKKDSKMSLFDGGRMSVLRRSKSVSFLGKANTTKNSPSTKSSSKAVRKSPPGSPSLAPVSKNAAAVDHKGYLTMLHKSKKKPNTRYWCILADSCLFCYTTIDQEFAADVIALGGYRIATTSSPSSHSSSSIIRLERFGKEDHLFLTDSKTEYSQWIIALTNVLYPKQNDSTLKRSASSNQPKGKKNLAAVYERSMSDVGTEVNKIKEKLLEEVLAHQREILKQQLILEKLTSQSPPSMKASSVSSLAQSEDNGYSSSADVLSHHELYQEGEGSRQNSPTSMSFRSISTVSVASSVSLSSMSDDKKKSNQVSAKVLAEIEEFRSFSQRTLQRRQSESPSL